MRKKGRIRTKKEQTRKISKRQNECEIRLEKKLKRNILTSKNE